MASTTEPVLSFIRYCYKFNPYFPREETNEAQMTWISQKWKNLSSHQQMKYQDETMLMPVKCVHCQSQSDDSSGWYAFPEAYASGFAQGCASPAFVSGWNGSSDFPTTNEDAPELISNLILKSRGGKLWICPSQTCRSICFPTEYFDYFE